MPVRRGEMRETGLPPGRGGFNKRPLATDATAVAIPADVVRVVWRPGETGNIAVRTRVLMKWCSVMVTTGCLVHTCVVRLKIFSHKKSTVDWSGTLARRKAERIVGYGRHLPGTTAA